MGTLIELNLIVVVGWLLAVVECLAENGRNGGFSLSLSLSFSQWVEVLTGER